MIVHLLSCKYICTIVRTIYFHVKFTFTVYENIYNLHEQLQACEKYVFFAPLLTGIHTYNSIYKHACTLVLYTVQYVNILFVLICMKSVVYCNYGPPSRL